MWHQQPVAWDGREGHAALQLWVVRLAQRLRAIVRPGLVEYILAIAVQGRDIGGGRGGVCGSVGQPGGRSKQVKGARRESGLQHRPQMRAIRARCQAAQGHKQRQWRWLPHTPAAGCKKSPLYLWFLRYSGQAPSRAPEAASVTSTCWGSQPAWALTLPLASSACRKDHSRKGFSSGLEDSTSPSQAARSTRVMESTTSSLSCRVGSSVVGLEEAPCGEGCASVPAPLACACDYRRRAFRARQLGAVQAASQRGQNDRCMALQVTMCAETYRSLAQAAVGQLTACCQLPACCQRMAPSC